MVGQVPVPQQQPACNCEYAERARETAEADKRAFWADFKVFGAPVITGSQVASTSDKQTNLGDVINAIKS